MKPIIAVIGGGTATRDEMAAAATVGRVLAEQGAVLVCGGLGGVMEAAAQGAKAAGGVTVGLLPGDDPAAANASIDIPLATRLGELRNMLIVNVAQALIAIGGGAGTLSEIAFARRVGKPVVGLHDAFTTAIDIPRVATPDAAVRWALERAQARVV